MPGRVAAAGDNSRGVGLAWPGTCLLARWHLSNSCEDTMQTIERMMSTTPNKPAAKKESLADCVDACVACELACIACADACLGESDVAMFRKCIRLNLDCADVCGTTARLLARLLEADVEILRAQLEACARACATCGAECHRHGSKHAHCKVCGDACVRCDEACRKVLQELKLARA